MVVKKQRDLVWKSADNDWDSKKMKLKIYTGFWSVEDGYQTCIVYVNYSYNKGKLCHIASWLAYYWESNFCNQLVCAGIRTWITQKHQSTQQPCNSQLEVTLFLLRTYRHRLCYPTTEDAYIHPQKRALQRARLFAMVWINYLCIFFLRNNSAIGWRGCLAFVRKGIRMGIFWSLNFQLWLEVVVKFLVLLPLIAALTLLQV